MDSNKDQKVPYQELTGNALRKRYIEALIGFVMALTALASTIIVGGVVFTLIYNYGIAELFNLRMLEFRNGIALAALLGVIWWIANLLRTDG